MLHHHHLRRLPLTLDRTFIIIAPTGLLWGCMTRVICPVENCLIFLLSCLFAALL